MKITSFLSHWSLEENPFKAEEARQDSVFARLQSETSHPDFEKVVGDLSRPASSVVFGEKGSGKTAIRLQLEDSIGTHNSKHTDQKNFIVAYDELNPFLDRLVRQSRNASTVDTLKEIRLVDHIDGILAVGVPEMISAALKDAKGIRKLDPTLREDWRLLQALYDQPEHYHERALRLRRALRIRKISWARPLKWAAIALSLIFVVSLALLAYAKSSDSQTYVHWIAVFLSGAVTLVSAFNVALSRLRLGQLSRAVCKQLRFVDRSVDNLRDSLERMPWTTLRSMPLPTDELDDPRYAMLSRFQRALESLGYKNIIVLIDRVDEPTLISGDTERMRAVIWPLFNNKFLQQNNIALKMLLPLELRHELYKQSEDFFQEARLDKQNMIDRLQWSGATLYDLCGSRMNACLAEGSGSLSLTELFEDEVQRQDIVDALDQMRQPRDAFKMMYQLIQEHCSNTTEEEERFQIPKLVLDQVRRAQSERLEGLQRGYRPA